MRRKDRSLMVCLLAALLMPLLSSGQAEAGAGRSTSHHSARGQAGEGEWLRVAPRDEEFSILTPARPSFIKRSGGYSLREGGEKILEHRHYSAYGGDFVFVIESFKAAHPQRVYKDLDRYAGQGAAFEREVTMGGFSGRQYRMSGGNFYGKLFTVVTERHVYVIKVATREENNTAAERFLSSLVLGDTSNTPGGAEALDVRKSAAYKNALSNSPEVEPEHEGQVFNTREVSRRAIFVLRPEPGYTEQARQNRVTGTVVLKAVLTASGEVDNVVVKRGLGSGLTEKAIEAALLSRFFPAEKDGKPVSQSIQIEYNFNVY